MHCARTGSLELLMLVFQHSHADLLLSLNDTIAAAAVFYFFIFLFFNNQILFIISHI
jgi:hypothetical protein